MKGDEFSGITFYDKEQVGFSKNEKELIAENVKRILLTRKGERVNDPEFGSNVLSFLFLPQLMVSDLIQEIKYSIEKFEPRVKVLSCSLVSATQDEVITIELELEILSSKEDENIINVEVNI